MKTRGTVIWFEVENLLRYFDQYATPTGIERVCMEVFGAAHHLSGEISVKFCRLSMFTGRFEQITFEQIRSAYTSGRCADAPWKILPLARSPWRAWRSILGAAVRFSRCAYRMFGQVLRDVAGALWEGDEKVLAAGDVIVSVGSSWVIHDFHGQIARLKRNHKVRFAQVVHDLIPILYPSWTPSFGRAFQRWLRNILGISDVLITISQQSRRDLESWAAAEGLALPPVRTIRYGTGFPAGFRSASRAHLESAGIQSLPERFVLCVSSFETRKNHELLLAVWRNLIATHGAGRIPHLILVGRVDDFVFGTRSIRAKLRDPGFRQRVIIAGNLNDRDLAEVYRRCLFTVFASLYEGWGLPVEESLAHGKFCVTSKSSSIPEVGGDWVDYFDPKDANDAERVVGHALFEPGYVEARELHIRERYRPFSWLGCTRELIQVASIGQ